MHQARKIKKERKEQRGIVRRKKERTARDVRKRRKRSYTRERKIDRVMQGTT